MRLLPKASQQSHRPINDQGVSVRKQIDQAGCRFSRRQTQVLEHRKGLFTNLRLARASQNHFAHQIGRQGVHLPNRPDRLDAHVELRIVQHDPQFRLLAHGLALDPVDQKLPRRRRQ